MMVAAAATQVKIHKIKVIISNHNSMQASSKYQMNYRVTISAK
jgi:hypothetical protein